MHILANNGVVNMHDKDEVQIEDKDSTRRFWSYTTFAFLFNKFEKRYWEFGKKAKMKHDWEAFTTFVNTHFSTNVQCTWG